MRDRSPAEDILDVACAENIDLIVMSSHGKGGLARWTFGSVAERVARYSPCPVLLVRQRPETARDSQTLPNDVVLSLPKGKVRP